VEKRRIEVQDPKTGEWATVPSVECVCEGDTFRTFEPDGTPVVVTAIAAKHGYIEDDGIGTIEFDMPPGILAEPKDLSGE
jgi:hypothetical protein